MQLGNGLPCFVKNSFFPCCTWPISSSFSYMFRHCKIFVNKYIIGIHQVLQYAGDLISLTFFYSLAEYHIIIIWNKNGHSMHPCFTSDFSSKDFGVSPLCTRHLHPAFINLLIFCESLMFFIVVQREFQFKESNVDLQFINVNSNTDLYSM